MEQYLIDDYNCFSNKWLTSEDEIEDYFKDNYEDCQIPNKNHITIGKKIPREALKDIYKERIITSKKSIADF